MSADVIYVGYLKPKETTCPAVVSTRPWTDLDGMPYESYTRTDSIPKTHDDRDLVDELIGSLPSAFNESGLIVNVAAINRAIKAIKDSRPQEGNADGRCRRYISSNEAPHKRPEG